MVTPADLGLDLESLFQPVIELIRPFLATLSLIFGGIFGLYVLLIIFRVYYERKKVKLLRGILYNSNHLNAHFDVPNASQRKGIFGKAYHYVRGSRSEEEKDKGKHKTHKKEEHKKNSKKKE